MKRLANVSEEHVASILRSASYLLHAGLLLGLLSSPEDGGYKFLRLSPAKDL
jgi:hypothetical protein